MVIINIPKVTVGYKEMFVVIRKGLRNM